MAQTLCDALRKLANSFGLQVAKLDPSAVNTAGLALMDSNFMKLGLAVASRNHSSTFPMRTRFSYHPFRFSRLHEVARVGSCVDAAVPVSLGGSVFIQREKCR